jgi:pimeloyl-ACP methyl ester carboxylesterase/DNA-binding SARP family transcriptional activator
VIGVRVLGAVGIERDGVPQEIGSAKQRLLIAVLAAHRDPVPRHRLVDALWEGDPPPSAESTLLGYISRLRSLLGRDVLIGGPEGYSLRVDELDAEVFARLVAQGGVTSLEAALALWHGQAYGDLAGHPFLVADAHRLDELRTQARVALAELRLAAGDLVHPISMLEAVVADSPTHEGAWLLLVRAFVEAGRHADAARAAYRCRRSLSAVGLEPSAALVEAEATAYGRDTRRRDRGRPSPVEVSPVRYARNGAAHLAYQILGGGRVDLVLSSYGSISIDAIWDCPPYAEFITRLAARCRVVLYDTRGIGLSDPIDVHAPPSLEAQSDDLRAVLDAAHAERAVVVGVMDGGPTAITYADRYPDGLVGLVLINTFARALDAPAYRGLPRDRFEELLQLSTDPDSMRDTSLVLRNHAPSVADDAQFRTWWTRAGRRGASPATASALWRVRYGADVRDRLGGLVVPTLVMHRHGSRVVARHHGEYLAAQIPGAAYVEVDGFDQPPFTEGADLIAERILEFAESR